MSNQAVKEWQRQAELRMNAFYAAFKLPHPWPSERGEVMSGREPGPWEIKQTRDQRGRRWWLVFRAVTDGFEYMLNASGRYSSAKHFSSPHKARVAIAQSQPSPKEQT